MRTAALCLSLSAFLAAQTFNSERGIQPSGRGAQRLDVDLALLGGSRGALADLRLYDAAGRELPYVLVPPGDEAAPWKAGRLLALPATREQSGVEVDLGEPVRTARMRLQGLRAPFLKRFGLEGSGDRQRWTTLVGQGTLFDLPEEGLRRLEVDFPAGEYRYLRLLWNDRSSAPVALPRQVAVQLPAPGARAPLEAVPFLRRASEPGVSRFTVRLPGPRLPLRALVLDAGGTGPLLREIRVTESRLQEGGLVPRELGCGLLKRVERDGEAAGDLRVPLSVPEGTELDLRVEDGNNPPLDLKGVAVELEPQPWIYFESPSDAPLVARFGDARLAAPKYDLEALKDRLRPSLAAAAHWTERRGLPGPVGADPFVEDPGPGAGLDASSFPERRRVPDASPGLCALALDAHVLSRSRTLQDLRILDPQGRQIPYLLERRDEPLELPLTLPERRAAGSRSIYRLRLPLRDLPAGRVVLETDARLFQRRVVLKASLEGGVDRVLAEGLWQHVGREALPPALVLPLPGQRGQDLVLEIDEGDNQPLPLLRLRLLLPSWHLRFFHPGAGLTLRYGNSDLGAPRYDLVLLASRLRSAPVRELALGEDAPVREAAARDAQSGASTTRWIFWTALGATVVVLLALLARLLRAENPKRPPDVPPDAPGGP